MELQQVNEASREYIHHPKKGLKRRMIMAWFLAFALLAFIFYGFNAAIDATLAGVIVWVYGLLNTIMKFLFFTAGGYNNKTLFIGIIFIVFALLGMYHYLGKWALWLCSRDKERGPLYSWMPNFLYHDYALERYRLANKNEEIKKMQEKITEVEKYSEAQSILVVELQKSVRDSERDRRLVLNLDHLVGKCFNLAAKSFTIKDRSPYRLSLFLNSVCAEICSTTMDNRNNKHAYIFLRDYSEDKMVLIGECRSGSSIDSRLMFSKGEGFVGKVWDQNDRLLIKDIQLEASDIIVKKGERRYNSIVGVPIYHLNEMIGIVVVASQSKDELNEGDFDNIERYLNIIQLSLLIELSYEIPLKGGDENAILIELLSKKTFYSGAKAESS
jgi:putative methionine-R-sulfoxide reductase with GAF domain